ncbi:MAG TPA: GNAT family N-acetyltransferase [Chloroflexota bacterium]|nr:GNAT family N-acetyltransferase [Chloroflexota bacterium]
MTQPQSGCLRTARPEDLPAIVDLACTAFGEKLRERFRQGLYADSSYRPEQSWVAEVDGRIVSHVRVRDRPIRYGSAVLRMGGIGTVATLPAYRGRGLATALLTDAIDSMRAQGLHLSMLFTGRFTFYARLGWAAFPLHCFQWPLPIDRLAVDPTSYRVRTFDSNRDLAGVEAVYDEYNHRRTGTHVRSSQFWREGIAQGRRLAPTLVADREGVVVAYATFRSRGDAVQLDEAGCRAGAASAFAPLARAIVEEGVAAGAQRIEGHLPRSHGLLAALARLSSVPIEGRLRGGVMLRVVDLHGLFQAALPALSERLSRHEWLSSRQASFGFRVRGDYVRLSLDRGDLALDAEPAERVLDLGTSLFFRLFFGESPLALLAEDLTVGGLDPGGDELALLGALFPPQDPFYWAADDF